MPELILVRGDKNYIIEFEVRDAEGNIVDLSEVTGIKFKMKKYGATSLTIDKSASVVPPGTQGLCQVLIETELLNEYGEYYAELEITWTGDKVLTAPNIFVKVLKDLR